MDAVGVVILKLTQLFFQIASIPEKNLVQVFASDGADEPLGKRMRYGHIGYGFNRLSFTNPQIRPPLVVAIQGVMILAEIAGCAFIGCGLVEHPAKGGAIDIASMHPKSNDSPRELIHDEKGPVGFEHYGLTSKQVDAPKTVFHMADESEPRGSISSVRAITVSEDTPHDVLVDIDAKGPGNLLRDPGHPNLGFLCFISKMSWMSSGDGPLGPGFPLLFEE